MKGKWEHGGIFSRVFGISLRRRKVKLLQVTFLTGSSEFCVTSLVQFPSLSRFGQPLDWQGSCSADAVLRSAAREEASGCEHVDAPNTKLLRIRQCYNTQQWIRQGFRHQNWRWKNPSSSVFKQLIDWRLPIIVWLTGDSSSDSVGAEIGSAHQRCSTATEEERTAVDERTHVSLGCPAKPKYGWSSCSE